MQSAQEGGRTRSIVVSVAVFLIALLWVVSYSRKTVQPEPRILRLADPPVNSPEPGSPPPTPLLTEVEAVPTTANQPAIRHVETEQDRAAWEKALPRLTCADLTLDRTKPVQVGKTFWVEGRATAVYRARGDLLVLKVEVGCEHGPIGVPIFASLGDLDSMPSAGDSVRVIGKLGRYKDEWQLEPLAKADVRVTVRMSDLNTADAYSLSRALDLPGRTLLVGPLVVQKMTPFVSKQGRQHLRLVLTNLGGGEPVGGVMWEGTWGTETLLLENQPVFVLAKIDTYKNAPSLVVARMEPAPRVNRDRPRP